MGIDYAGHVQRHGYEVSLRNQHGGKGTLNINKGDGTVVSHNLNMPQIKQYLAKQGLSVVPGSMKREHGGKWTMKVTEGVVFSQREAGEIKVKRPKAQPAWQAEAQKTLKELTSGKTPAPRTINFGEGEGSEVTSEYGQIIERSPEGKGHIS